MILSDRDLRQRLIDRSIVVEPLADLGLGARWVGRSYADPANRVALPGYVTLDASVSYRPVPFELSLLITNLTQTTHHYVASINGSQLTPGAPRTLFVTWRFER